MSEKQNKQTMYDKLNENQQSAQIPYYVHEMEMTRLERLNKRLWIFLLIVFIALVGTNAGWIIYESQFQDEVYSYEVSQDSGEGGENTYTGNTVNIMGGDYNGEANDQSNGETAGAEVGE